MVVCFCLCFGVPAIIVINNVQYVCMYVCMYVWSHIHIARVSVLDQPGKVACQSCSWSAEQGNIYIYSTGPLVRMYAVMT